MYVPVAVGFDGPTIAILQIRIRFNYAVHWYTMRAVSLAVLPSVLAYS